jgi:hypothetical protein
MDGTKVWAFIGAVVGGATWVAVVGGTVTAIRLAPLGVSPAETVALMPSDQRLAIGLRFVALPLLLALLAYALLLLLRPTTESSTEKAGNAAGEAPRGLSTIVAIGALLALPIAIWSNVSTLAHGALFVVPILAAFALHYTVRATSNWWQAAFALFAGVAVTAGIMAVVYELGRDPRLDVVAVQRTDLPAVAGFYVSKTDDSIVLVTPTLVGGTTRLAGRFGTSGAARNLPPGTTHCPNDVAAARLRDSPTPCFVNELTVMPYSAVERVVLGPRGVVVNGDGYRSAYALATLAGMRFARARDSTATSSAK